MGNLNGKAGGKGDTQAGKQPGGAGYQTDGRRGTLPQGAHHGGVDILHQDGADLRQDGGDTQPDHQGHPGPEAQRPGLAQKVQGIVLAGQMAPSFLKNQSSFQ